MSTLPKIPSISDEGLEKYLNKHYSNKGGYAEFVKRIKLDEYKPTIGTAFGVTKQTIWRWYNIYTEELKHAKPRT